MSLAGWKECEDWLNGVVFDDPAVSDYAETILHPAQIPQGFIPGDPVENPMRALEDYLEQNDNSFDGIINNVPAAPVPDFAEINEKADQEDIIADTKASVMEKIKEQQEKVKLAPIPEPEKKTPVICPCREM